jgi:hypothetical protein
MASKHFIRSIVQPVTAFVASAINGPIDLPVNPLTMILLRLRVTRAAETAAGLYTMLNDMVKLASNVNVQLLGQNIINGSLQDIMFFNALAFNQYPKVTRSVRTTGAVAEAVFPICFGRRTFWDMECLPPVARGNLRFQWTATALPANFSAVSWAVEAVELIEAAPKQYMKYIANTKALTATGQFDAPIPIGNKIMGIMLFEPNIFGTTARAFSWGQVKLLVDNFEQYYPLSDWEALVGRYALDVQSNPFLVSDHLHPENLAAAYAQFADTDGVEFAGKTYSPDAYGFMDFDPNQDDMYLLETAGHADVKLRGFADAAAPNATVLWYPGEIVAIQ